MPAKSKAQMRFMQMMAHNPEKAKNKADISPEKAKEFISKNKGKMSYKNLPEKKKKRDWKSLKK